VTQNKRRKSSSNKTTKSKSRVTKKNKNDNLKYELIVLSILAGSLIMLLAIYLNKGGLLGQILRNLFFGLFGIGAYILPIFLLVSSFMKIFNKENKDLNNKIILSFFIVMLISVLAHIANIQSAQINNKINGKSTFFISLATFYNVSAKFHTSGGLVGGLVGDLSTMLLGKLGSYIVISLIIVSLVVLISQISIAKTGVKLGKRSKKASKTIINKSKEAINETTKQIKDRKNNKEVKVNEENMLDITTLHKDDSYKLDQQISDMEKIEEIREEDRINNNNIQINLFDENVNDQKTSNNQEKQVSSSIDINVIEDEIKDEIDEKIKEYEYPPIELLKENPFSNVKGSKDILKKNAQKLEQTLESFGVRARVLNVSCGPTVTRYELQPEQGVKVSKIVNLSDDIALNLAASGIRIEAPIPGKAAVGIEVPNKEVKSVFLKEVIGTEEFKSFPSNVAFALGKDISGQVIIADIGRMPHLLIAGATGSGKSVCVNTLITSILYKSSPSDVKLLMIDPKVVELSIYNGIPHLLIPVVTDPKKAAGALNWAVQEMSDRYKLFAAANVRDMKGYNKFVEETGEGKKLPQIVIIVDELADLMMVAPNDIEDAICRLAQMARAAGLHLIIATQRPSVDVITGLIKANIPSRISFSVSSGTDSRTIIDMNGAEKLLGKGDMLFYPVGLQKPLRVQGAFISDKEVEQIVDFLKDSQETIYNNKIISHIYEEKSSNDMLSDKDEYFTEALELVIEKQKASASMIQRRFRVGYNRAARIVDQLQEAGFVGEAEGSKPRKVLLTKEEYYNLKNKEEKEVEEEVASTTKEVNKN
jgi:S-DNA-T family DNA segregation ATPase FtsK/SpoIIIE